MKEMNYLFWHTMGVALTVPAFVGLLTKVESIVNITLISLGVLSIILATFINARNLEYGRTKEAFIPLLMDFGANLFVAGLYLEPSPSKVFLLLGSVLIIELFLLILVVEVKK